jgi:S-adenosylmethionine-diacylgycerolhomoserine-N-methlytransferase
MLLAPIRGHSHAERLESFYRGQASGYDAFRARLLHGRRELWTSLPIPDGGVWIDMGGGTASNLEYLGDAVSRLARIYVVDLCAALLQVAQQRLHTHRWTNVRLIAADATRFVPPEGAVDVVTLAYSLTMIPNWFVAVDHSWQLLRPGGIIGVVDFYVSRKYPEAGRRRHKWYRRTFWPIWFGFDNVFPSPDHVAYLHYRFTPLYFSEQRATMPYFPAARVPYYVFIGRKSLPVSG